MFLLSISVLHTYFLTVWPSPSGVWYGRRGTWHYSSKGSRIKGETLFCIRVCGHAEVFTLWQQYTVSWCVAGLYARVNHEEIFLLSNFEQHGLKWTACETLQLFIIEPIKHIKGFNGDKVQRHHKILSAAATGGGFAPSDGAFTGIRSDSVWSVEW